MIENRNRKLYYYLFLLVLESQFLKEKTKVKVIINYYFLNKSIHILPCVSSTDPQKLLEDYQQITPLKVIEFYYYHFLIIIFCFPKI